LDRKGDNILNATRVEQHVIRRHDALWKTVDMNCYLSKNLYNYANYEIRKRFIEDNYWLRYAEMAGTMKNSDPYKELMSQPSQQTLTLLDGVWKSFFMAIKDWKKNPRKYLGRPKLPGYLPKDGRYIWSIKNNGCRIRNGRLEFIIKRLSKVSIPTKARGRLLCVRFVPKGTCYVMEIVTEVEAPEQPKGEPNRIVGIDLGVNNLVTVANNIGLMPIIVNGKGVKSINQFYNKRKAQIQSELMIRNGSKKSRRLEEMSFKRFCRIKTMFHQASRMIVDYCVANHIDTLVCGLNKGWKQEINTGKQNNQRFSSIPYDMLIKQFAYKCQDAGIRFTITEEAYTSGTSVLDGEHPIKENYDKSRRVKRGLFKWSGGFVNADVNAACQIIKKVSPNAFADGVGAEDLQPVILNIA
jgi:putative transposase